jgi:hypothetical protein
MDVIFSTGGHLYLFLRVFNCSFGKIKFVVAVRKEQQPEYFQIALKAI